MRTRPPARAASARFTRSARAPSARLARTTRTARTAGFARAALCALAALAACSCGNADFEPASRVAKLRVLAVRASPPFARPGEEVRLEALAVDPAGRALRWGWSTCLEPPDASALACLETAPPLEALPDPNAWTLRIPEDALAPAEGPVRRSATLGVNVIVCPGAITAGPTGSVPIGCVDEAGQSLGLAAFEVGTKRIAVRAVDRNENPRIEGLSWQGAEWPEGLVPEVDACDEDGNDFDECGDSLTASIALTLGPAESGVDELGVDFAEQQIVQYYASEGIFKDEVRAAPSTETRWAARRSASGTIVTFWFIARDDRGGVTWTTRQVQVR